MAHNYSTFATLVCDAHIWIISWDFSHYIFMFCEQKKPSKLNLFNLQEVQKYSDDSVDLRFRNISRFFFFLYLLFPEMLLCRMNWKINDFWSRIRLHRLNKFTWVCISIDFHFSSYYYFPLNNFIKMVKHHHLYLENVQAYRNEKRRKKTNL